MKHATVVALLPILVLSLATTAGPVDCESPKTEDIIACEEHSLTQREAELSELSRRINAQLGPEQIVLFGATEHAWETFRYTTCASVMSLYDEGSMGPIAFVACKAAMAKSRVQQVREMYGAVVPDIRDE